MTDAEITFIVENEPNLYFYSHGDGYNVPVNLALALDRGRDRWDDYPYLARIIFCGMISEDYFYKTTGFGISTDSMRGTAFDIFINATDQLITYKDNDYTYEGFIEEFGKEKDL